MEKAKTNKQLIKLYTQNIYWGVKEKQILKNISIGIKNQEIVGLIGPNGSGKSSLLRLLYKFYTPQKGRVFFSKKDISLISQKAIAQHIAVVLQEKEGLNNMTVYEIVLMGRHPYKELFEKDTDEDHLIVLNALKKVNLKNKVDRIFATLSGGEKQRVLIAIAIAQQAKLLILDEPTNHLDPHYQLQIMNVIKSLQIPTIVSIHDLNLASMFCNRLILLKNGKVFCEGTTKEVLTKDNIKKVYNVDVVVRNNKKNNSLNIVYLNSKK